jgi:hypothetical protein
MGRYLDLIAAHGRKDEQVTPFAPTTKTTETTKSNSAPRTPEGNLIYEEEIIPEGGLGRFRRFGRIDKTLENTFEALERRRPELIENADWQRAVADGRKFLTEWGADAVSFGWTAEDLFGLPPIPERPAPNYRRLSRYDLTGLIWLLRGRPVVGIGADEAVMATPGSGQLTFTKPHHRY